LDEKVNLEQHINERTHINMFVMILLTQFL